ncbi:carbohydrate-binding module family 50 protein [Gelatoporia subvermispora B]|uniref:Carbohydrate-binding module family 50 protein n=1 Tax=Ceriporiopsis subvermispora (strain B) TaxID=914234 RepID=M2Q6Y5_CERS8|nr:carbohydrate-binding module family 50 protein [Gelatoporia subvermispora B]
MGRWTQYDEDDYRLPEGMKRVGYDADTGKYHFRDQDGTLWEGPEGASYGEMRRVSGTPQVVSQPDEAADEGDDLEAAPARADGYQPLAADPSYPPHSASRGSQISSYRMMFPFFLLVVVVLLLVIRLVHSPSAIDPPLSRLCPNSTEVYRVQQGDTCWGLSQTRGSTVDKVREVNPGLECDKLTEGQLICLPERVAVRF